MAQTAGGRAAFSFLNLPSSPLLTAAGGVNLSYDAADASLTANNPSLLRPAVSSQVSTGFTAFLGGIKNYALTGAYHLASKNISLGAHVQYLDYGSIAATDAAGTVSGAFRPRDFAVQVSGAKRYLERWTYGLSVKYIASSYPPYSATALAADVGLSYADSTNQLRVSVLAKNMGVQLKTYASESEDLPFDLQVGISKRLQKAPFGFSVTARHLQRFALGYNDEAFNNENGFSPPSSFDKIFNHFVVASHVYLGQNLEATLGYNHLRRQELSVPSAANGLAGFSAGLYLRFSKLHVMFSRSAYQRGVAYNQIGITAQMDKLFGLGKSD